MLNTNQYAKYFLKDNLDAASPIADPGNIAHSNDSIRVVTVRDFDALDSHVPAWNSLVHKAPKIVSDLLPSWIESFLRHRLKPIESWFCSFAYSSDELVGALPVVIAPHPILGRRWPLLRNPGNPCDIPLTAEYPEAVLHALLAEVSRQEPRHLRLDLRCVRQTSPMWPILANGIDGYLVHRGRREMYSYLDVRGDFDAYMSNFGHMGRNLRRFRKKLEKLGHVSIEVRKGSAASADLLREFLALEASGWKGRNGSATLNNPNKVRFYAALTQDLAMRGDLEWHTIRVDERLVAAQLAIRYGTSLLLEMCAFDEDFADCRLGTLLTEATFREGFSSPEIEEVNPMSDFDMNRIWHMPRDAYVDVHLIRRNALPFLLQLPILLPRSAYQVHVRPRIPIAAKKVYRKFKHQEDRRPRRAADAVRLRQE